MRSFKTKIFSICLVVLITAGILGGCTTPPATESSNTESSSEVSKPDYPESITLMASQNWIKDIDRTLFKKFETETGIEVKVLVTPDNGYETLLGTTLSGGSNSIDIFMYSGGMPFISAGIPDIAVDLTNEEWASRLEDWSRNFNTHEDILYGFNTWSNGYEGILYNKTYFAENGLTIPKTWDEFITLCDKIVELGEIPFYENINGVWHTQCWIYGMTPALLEENPDLINFLNSSKDNKLSSLNSMKQGIEQLSFFLSEKVDEKPKYYTNDGQAEDWFGSYPSLQNRETVMIFTYDAYSKELAANGSADEWGMFPSPILDGTATVSNGGGISKFINKNSNSVDACKLFLSFLAEPENLNEYYAARNDFSNAAFKGVTSVIVPLSTEEAVTNSSTFPVTMLLKDMLYWDPDIYKYCQGLADGSMTPEKFIENMDAYRATMFDAAN